MIVSFTGFLAKDHQDAVSTPEQSAPHATEYVCLRFHFAGAKTTSEQMCRDTNNVLKAGDRFYEPKDCARGFELQCISFPPLKYEKLRLKLPSHPSKPYFHGCCCRCQSLALITPFCRSDCSFLTNVNQ